MGIAMFVSSEEYSEIKSKKKKITMCWFVGFLNIKGEIILKNNLVVSVASLIWMQAR